MSPFAVSVRKEWLEHWRNYRFLVLVVVLTLFGLLAPFTARYTPEMMKLLPNGEAIARLMPPPSRADAVTQYLKSVSQFGVILALLLTMGTVAQEKDRGTAAMMLVKPLPRSAFVLAKFAALALLFTLGIGAAGLAAWYYTWLLFGPLDPARWLALNALVLGFVLVQVAVTLLFSVVARSQAAAGGLAFGGLMLLAIVSSIPVVGTYLPAQLLAWAAALMAGNPTTAWPALAISGLIGSASLLGAVILFERQEV
jgi:ABC-2 type transport system permease protein